MTLRRTLIHGATAFGLELTDEQADACRFYLVELEKWNRKINLTAIRGEQEIAVKHFLDSFSYVLGFDTREGARLLDMGSGAGFPALPLKIALPGLKITLVESVQKKASFLRHIIRMLKLDDAHVLDTRTDRLSPDHHGAYDIVTARAFADMTLALQEGSRFLRPRGRMVLSRGPGETVGEEVVHASAMTGIERKEIVLPFSDHRRTIWVFRKND